MPVPALLKQGRYRVVATLSRGERKTTYEGVDRETTRRVAIKRLPVRGAAAEELERAEREAAILERVSHPNIARFVDFFEEDGCLCLVTEHVEGEALSARRNGPVIPEAVVRLLVDLGAALAHLHARAAPIVHRDVHPGNIIRRVDCSHVLIGFGAACVARQGEARFTYPGLYGYVAPELTEAIAAPAMDTYGAGATALALLSGREPEELPRDARGLDLRSALRDVGDPRWEGVLKQLLAPDPASRPCAIPPLLAGFVQVREGVQRTVVRTGVDRRSEASPARSDDRRARGRLAPRLPAPRAQPEVVEQPKPAKRPPTPGAKAKLQSREYFDATYARLASQCIEIGRPFALVLCVMGGWGEIRRECGTAIADGAVTGVADILRAECYGGGIPCKMGDASFAVMVPDVTLKQASTQAERVRSSVARTRFKIGGEVIMVTVSLGACSVQFARTPDALYREAARRLELAQRHGGNAVY